MDSELEGADMIIRRRTRGAQAPPFDRADISRSPARIMKVTSAPTAMVYCEGNFARTDGKTANGLIRHSQAYRIVSVIDGDHAGSDSGLVLDGINTEIPIFADLEAAIMHETTIPDTLIYGMAPSTGKLSPQDRGVVLDAIALGMNIVSGLHDT